MTPRDGVKRRATTTANRRVWLVPADPGSPSRVVRAVAAGRSARRWMYLAIGVLFALVLATHHRADDLTDLNHHLDIGAAKAGPMVGVASADLQQAIRAMGPGSDADRKKPTIRRD